MKKIYLFIPILALIALVSCEEKKVSNETITQLTSLRDSANKAWEIMIKSDDQKINDMSRLLLEVSYCQNYNAMLLDSLNSAVKSLKENRYKQFTMQSAEIDSYDELTNKVISRVNFLALNTEELKSHPIAETLYNDIAKADNEMWKFRRDYDNFALQYNTMLEANKDALGDNAKDFQKLPVFTITPA